MIINDIKPTLELSEKMDVASFGISDLGFVFDILRNKMYGNPKLAIVRELVSNAVDSHREAGKPNEPIQIVLPNALDPHLRIKDFGVGISPERADKIYRWYGASSKRDDNSQIGGWGLGAKVGFSYTDCYNVDTIYQGIHYNYSCVIDPSKVGQLIKMSETSTDLPNATEVVIPIKPADFRAFCDGVEFICRHLNPKPIIKGGKITWQTPSYILEGSNWKIATTGGYSRQPRLLIDSIEYPLDLAQLPDASSLRIFYDVQGDTVFLFNTGELSLSASREAVHLDKPTSDKIIARAKAAYTELQATFQKKIDACETLKDAYIAYTQLKSTVSSLPTLRYKGTQLATELYVPYMSEWYKSYNTASHSSYLRFDSYNARPIYLNDLTNKTLTKKQIEKLFTIPDENGIKSDRVLIVNATDQSDDKWEASLEEKVKELHLEELGATYLSEVISLDPEKPVVPRMTVFKFGTGKFGRTKYQDFKDDKQEKVLCSLYKSTYSPVRFPQYKKGSLTSKQMEYVFDDDKISIYGLDATVKPEKVKKFFTGCKTLDEYITAKFSADKGHLIKAKAMQQVSNDAGCSKWASFLNSMDPSSSHLNDDVKKVVKQYKEQKAFAEKHYTEISSYETVMGRLEPNDVDVWIKENKTEAMDCGKAIAKLLKQYPLLSLIDYYAWSDNLPDIVAYMELIDNKNAKKETGK